MTAKVILQILEICVADFRIPMEHAVSVPSDKYINNRRNNDETYIFVHTMSTKLLNKIGLNLVVRCLKVSGQI